MHDLFPKCSFLNFAISGEYSWTFLVSQVIKEVEGGIILAEYTVQFKLNRIDGKLDVTKSFRIHNLEVNEVCNRGFYSYSADGNEKQFRSQIEHKFKNAKVIEVGSDKDPKNNCRIKLYPKKSSSIYLSIGSYLEHEIVKNLNDATKIYEKFDLKTNKFTVDIYDGMNDVLDEVILSDLSLD
ncbi:hypothetical protein [Carp edema virus]|nr:hypothetical protein [Carp edema virus]